MPGFSVIPTENGGESMACSDEALVGRIRRGDQAALEELVERWYPRVYAYARRMTGVRQDAQDVTQETFLAVLRHRKTFFRCNFQSWLFTIAHHKCIDLFRLQGRLTALPEELNRLSDPDPSGQVLDRAALEQALDRLLEQEQLTIGWEEVNGHG